MRYLIVLTLLILIGCTGTQKVQLSGGDHAIEIAILQMNDVYEIAGVDNGRQGGLSRVAYYYNQLKKQYPNSMLVISGDFLNPSLIGTMKHNGERVKGRQMIEALNACGLDLATFGNHEFDLDLEDLQLRIDESTFDWLATNVRINDGTPSGKPFTKRTNDEHVNIPQEYIKQFVDADGTTMNLGIFSTLTPVNKVDYVTYEDPFVNAQLAIQGLRNNTDLIVGLTHLDIDDDRLLAAQVTDIPLFIGGHDHDNMLHKVNNVVIAKADANAKTLYQHILRVSKSGRITVESTLIPMDDLIPQDSSVHAIIEKWNRILDDNVKQIIADPYEIIYVTGIPLDGRESTIRHRQSNMGTHFTQAMLQASSTNASCAMLNSGAIRIDDEINGEISAIDVFRALPFGGSIYEVTMTGSLLVQILDFGRSAKGSGGYLQLAGVQLHASKWTINEVAIDPEMQYTVALNDFLLAGYDMPFLTADTEGIIAIEKPDSGDSALKRDLRLAIIEYLKKL